MAVHFVLDLASAVFPSSAMIYIVALFAARLMRSDLMLVATKIFMVHLKTIGQNSSKVVLGAAMPWGPLQNSNCSWLLPIFKSSHPLSTTS